MATVIHRRDLPGGASSREFQGHLAGDSSLSFIWIESNPGDGPRLHRHPYEEIFVVIEGSATFYLGDEKVQVTTGDIVIGPANVPHRFVNNGPGALRQIDIHASDHFVTEWLEH